MRRLWWRRRTFLLTPRTETLNLVLPHAPAEGGTSGERHEGRCAPEKCLHLLKRAAQPPHNGEGARCDKSRRYNKPTNMAQSTPPHEMHASYVAVGLQTDGSPRELVEWRSEAHSHQAPSTLKTSRGTAFASERCTKSETAAQNHQTPHQKNTL